MSRRFSAIRVAIVVGLAMAGLAFGAAPAQATFHFMMIREIHPSVNGGDFVELQMYAGAQNFVGGHQIVAYDMAGGPGTTFTFPTNAANGENQRTILVSNSPGLSPDFLADGTNPLDLPPSGAVCFDGIDCVSWGSFAAPGALPGPTGNPAPAPLSGSSLERTIAPNCPTLLEPGDDTNDSATDFAIATPSPRNNATPPTETACGAGAGSAGGPDTKIDKGPKKKTKKKRAKFRFSSTFPGATFECSVDGKTFQACTSPFTVKVKKGRHTFEVRAVAGGVPDGSPAEQTWKVEKPKK
jgi:hypothetical protein